VLVGPDLPTTWTIDSTDSVRLGANVRVNNVRNLRGGSAADLFRSMNSSGTIAGNLDGGGGFNTLEYVSVPSPFVTNLANGVAPRVGGAATNIHAVIPEQLSFSAPTSRSDHDGDTISLQLTATSTVGGTLTYGASGLPAGLSINPATGLVSGTLALGNTLTKSYQVTVTVSNGTNSRLRTIAWDVIGETRDLLGDYNNDRSVDAADYIVWRKLGGNQAEYNTWRENFGTSLPAGAGAASLPQVDSDAPTAGLSPDTASMDAFETMTPRMSAVRPMPFELMLPRDNHLRDIIRTSLIPAVAATSHDEGLLSWLVSPVNRKREIHDGYRKFEAIAILAAETSDVELASIDTALDELLSGALSSGK
jgi:hypothetical protein